MRIYPTGISKIYLAGSGEYSNKIKNRRKATMICDRKCKFFNRGTCKIMNQYEQYIDKCILEHEKVKKIKKESLEEFVFNNRPLLYLSYVGYEEKIDLPKIGQKVLALTAGFDSLEYGKILKVTSIDEKYIHLKDEFDDEFDDEDNDYIDEYLVDTDKWWESIFKLEE